MGFEKSRFCWNVLYSRIKINSFVIKGQWITYFGLKTIFLSDFIIFVVFLSNILTRIIHNMCGDLFWSHISWNCYFFCFIRNLRISNKLTLLG